MEKPRHYAQIEPASVKVRVKIGERVLAESDEAMVLKEVGKRIYDAVYYLPRADVPAELIERTDTVTHCPIKGDASYFTVTTPEGAYKDLIWSYEDPLPRARRVAGHMAFDPRIVTMELIPRDRSAEG